MSLPLLLVGHTWPTESLISALAPMAGALYCLHAPGAEKAAPSAKFAPVVLARVGGQELSAWPAFNRFSSLSAQESRQAIKRQIKGLNSQEEQNAARAALLFLLLCQLDKSVAEADALESRLQMAERALKHSLDQAEGAELVAAPATDSAEDSARRLSIWLEAATGQNLPEAIWAFSRPLFAAFTAAWPGPALKPACQLSWPPDYACADLPQLRAALMDFWRAGPRAATPLLLRAWQACVGKEGAGRAELYWLPQGALPVNGACLCLVWGD